MKITLILSSYPNDPLRKNDPFMPLSLPLLASSAPEHEYTFVDMLAGEEPNYDEKVDLVGISVRITAIHTAKRIAEEYHKRGVTVIVGGPQISTSPHEAKKFADIIVVGEGESLWPVILNDIEKKVPKDFYVCSPKKFESKGFKVYQIKSYNDLKNIKTANRSLFKNNKYAFDTVFAARGCPIDCDFCSVTNIFGSKLRTRPIDNVVEEISSFKNYYYLLDDTVFGRPGSYNYYLELYEKISRLKKIKFWTGQANLDAAGNEKGKKVIKKAAEAGLLYAAIGMESINPDILRKSGVINKLGVDKKKDLLKQIKDNIRFIQEQGILISGWFTIGYKEDTIDTYYATWEFCKEMNIIPIISPLEALPGTKLYARLKKENRLALNKKINIKHPNMNDDEVFDALNIIAKKAFSNNEIIKRTMFYSKKFKELNKTMSQKITNKIHKTIFTFVTQHKLKKGVIGFANDEIV